MVRLENSAARAGTNGSAPAAERIASAARRVGLTVRACLIDGCGNSMREEREKQSPSASPARPLRRAEAGASVRRLYCVSTTVAAPKPMGTALPKASKLKLESPW